MKKVTDIKSKIDINNENQRRTGVLLNKIEDAIEQLNKFSDLHIEINNITLRLKRLKTELNHNYNLEETDENNEYYDEYW